MAKGSSRFRNRKIGFKTRLNIVTGAEAAEFEEDIDGGEIGFEEDKDQGKSVETGVDKEEENELHLQAIINAAQAQAAAKAFIPTPDAMGTIDGATFDALYLKGYVDPFTYIRFSDTVEDAQIGAPNYTMDDDDEEWLIKHNAAQARAQPGSGSIGDDEFEELMELFEHRTEQKAPMAHLDLDSLPSLDEMEAAFAEPNLRAEVATLKRLVPSVYPHWKDRRVRRSGKPIIAQLDYDESNEQNPYVCFRRRELKSSRKTRRSDQQNSERLVRLRNDLFAAHELMLKTRQREKLKLEAIQLERRVFESRVEMRELKRRVGEADGDEELLIGRREKRKRRDEPLQPGQAQLNSHQQSNSSLKLSLRRPDQHTLVSAASLVTPVEELRLRKDRAAAIAHRIERDLAKKKELDQHWDDATDAAYQARLPPVPARYWRTVEPVPGTIPYIGPNGKREALGFATTYQPAVGHPRSSFRRRVGRGGRIILDRISARASLVRAESGSDSEEDPVAAARRAERFRYDSDVAGDFPSASEPVILDDFAFAQLVRRASLLRPADVESLSLDSSYLDEAYRHAAQEPDKHVTPPIVYGRPPPRAPIQAGPGAGPGGIGMNGAVGQAAYGQMQLAAQQARLLAQQQAQLKRSQPQTQPQQMTKTPSTGMHISLPSPISLNTAPVQAQWANTGGVASPGGIRVGAGLMNSANGTRLAGTPLIQQVHAHSPLPIQPHMVRPASAQGLPQQIPSRPGSAASHHGLSPAMSGQGLPLQPMSLAGSPGPGGNRPSPPQGKRMGTSPVPGYPMQAGQSVGKQSNGIQSLPFGGFVQG